MRNATTEKTLGRMSAGLRIRLAAGAEETLALAAAHVGDVFAHVRHALLLLRLVSRASHDLQVRLEASRGDGVWEDSVLQAIGQRARSHARVWGQQRFFENLFQLLTRRDGALCLKHFLHRVERPLRLRLRCLLLHHAQLRQQARPARAVTELV